jgi:hypothetical protein
MQKIDRPALGRVVTNVTKITEDYVDVIFITQLERLIIWIYWLVR